MTSKATSQIAQAHNTQGWGNPAHTQDPDQPVFAIDKINTKELSTKERKTRARIKEALIELLEENGVERLTIRALAQRANINRGTVYLHFANKAEVVTYFENEVLSEIEQALTDPHYTQLAPTYPHTPTIFSKPALVQALHVIVDNIALIRAFVHSSSMGDPVHILKRVSDELLDYQLAHSNACICGSDVIPVPYARTVLISQVLAILCYWIESDGETPPYAIAEMIEEVAQNPTHSFICPAHTNK